MHGGIVHPIMFCESPCESCEGLSPESKVVGPCNRLLHTSRLASNVLRPFTAPELGLKDVPSMLKCRVSVSDWPAPFPHLSNTAPTTTWHSPGW